MVSWAVRILGLSIGIRGVVTFVSFSILGLSSSDRSIFVTIGYTGRSSSLIEMNLVFRIARVVLASNTMGILVSADARSAVFMALHTSSSISLSGSIIQKVSIFTRCTLA